MKNTVGFFAILSLIYRRCSTNKDYGVF